MIYITIFNFNDIEIEHFKFIINFKFNIINMNSL